MKLGSIHKILCFALLLLCICSPNCAVANTFSQNKQLLGMDNRSIPQQSATNKVGGSGVTE